MSTIQHEGGHREGAGTDDPGQAASPEVNEPGRWFRFAESWALVALWILLVIGFTIGEPGEFMTIGNWSNILGSQAVLFGLTLASLIPLLVGDFDLSLGSIAGLSAMACAVLNVQHHENVMVAAAIGVAAGLAVSCLNAFFIVKFNNDPFIITLGTMTIVTGVTYLISGSATVGVVSSGLTNWTFIKSFLDIPLEFWMMLVIFFVLWYVLGMTPVGQRALVVGQSRDVARLSGVRVAPIRVVSFLVAGLIAGIAGIVYTGTVGSVDPTAGSDFILPAVAAVFLGSTSIKPGRFNTLGAAVAVYFLTTGVAGLENFGAQDYVQQLFYGGALVIAVTLPRLSRNSRAVRSIF